MIAALKPHECIGMEKVPATRGLLQNGFDIRPGKVSDNGTEGIDLAAHRMETVLVGKLGLDIPNRRMGPLTERLDIIVPDMTASHPAVSHIPNKPTTEALTIGIIDDAMCRTYCIEEGRGAQPAEVLSIQPWNGCRLLLTNRAEQACVETHLKQASKVLA